MRLLQSYSGAVLLDGCSWFCGTPIRMNVTQGSGSTGASMSGTPIYRRLVEYLLYSAQKYNQHFYNHNVGYAWTAAVSKPPYFTALALWPNICAGFGGGVFDSERSGRVWYPFDNFSPHPDFNPAGHMLFTQDWLGSSYPDPKSQYRLSRDGWKLASRLAGANLSKASIASELPSV